MFEVDAVAQGANLPGDQCPICGQPTHAADSNDAGVCITCLDAAAIRPTSAECEDCGGSGVLIGDAVDGRGNHIDEVERCHCCVDFGDDRDPGERAWDRAEATIARLEAQRDQRGAA